MYLFVYRMSVLAYACIEIQIEIDVPCFDHRLIKESNPERVFRGWKCEDRGGDCGLWIGGKLLDN